MTVANAWYVRCDICGDPAPISCDNKANAKVLALDSGFRRVKGADVCPKHDVPPPAGRLVGAS